MVRVVPQPAHLARPAVRSGAKTSLNIPAAALPSMRKESTARSAAAWSIDWFEELFISDSFAAYLWLDRTTGRAKSFRLDQGRVMAQLHERPSDSLDQRSGAAYEHSWILASRPRRLCQHGAVDTAAKPR